MLADFVQQCRGGEYKILVFYIFTIILNLSYRFPVGALFDSSKAGFRSSRIHVLSLSSIPDERSVIDANWVSSDLLLLACTKGATVASDCSSLLLNEKTLSDYGSLTSFLTGITGAISFSERPDVLAVDGDTQILLSLDAVGTLRIWNHAEAPCAFQQQILGTGSRLQEAIISHCVLENKLFVAIVYRSLVVSSPSAPWALLLVSFKLNLSHVLDIEFEKQILLSQFHRRPRQSASSDWFQHYEGGHNDGIESVDVGFCRQDQDILFLMVNWKVKQTIESDSGELVLSIEDHLIKYSLVDDEDPLPYSVVENSKERLNNQLIAEDQDTISIYESYAYGDEEAIDAISATMLKRIFYPGRFSVDIIRMALQHDIPYDIQAHVASNTIWEDLSERVLFVCRVWAQHLSEYLRSDSNTHIDSLRRVFFAFLEVCERRRKRYSLLCDRSLARQSLTMPTLPISFALSRTLCLSLIVPLSTNMFDVFDSYDNEDNTQFLMLVRGFMHKEDAEGGTAVRELDMSLQIFNMPRSVSRVDDSIDYFHEKVLTCIQTVIEKRVELLEVTELERCFNRDGMVQTLLSDIERMLHDVLLDCYPSKLEFHHKDILKVSRRESDNVFAGECSSSFFAKLSQLVIFSKLELLNTIAFSLGFIRHFKQDIFIAESPISRQVSILNYYICFPYLY